MRYGRAMTEHVVGVVLAAGAGSRFGGGKLLAPLSGRPVLQHVLDRLAAAGIDDVIVVLGEDAPAIEAAIAWRTERRVRNPDPGRGLSSSLHVGVEAVTADPSAGAALIALGDQPLVPLEAIEALLASPPHPARPVVVPAYRDDRGRNPVLLRRAAFGLAAEAEGDRGLGPVLEANPELVAEIPVEGANPDLDTPADLAAIAEAAWATRVRANREQVDRIREVPDGTDFYAPVQSLFRADPTRTDDPVLERLLGLVRPGDRWLDVGAGQVDSRSPWRARWITRVARWSRSMFRLRCSRPFARSPPTMPSRTFERSKPAGLRPTTAPQPRSRPT